MFVISENIEPFFNIPLNLSNNIERSLDDYVADQILNGDNLYQTQLYGPQVAKKSVKFLILPPIIMVQLKRFEFNYTKGINQKIMHRFEYPSVIDFAKWQIEATGPCQYDLYAVLVHEGIKAQSGHYYAYVNINDCWYRFNDQEVSLASNLQVFNYNFGGEIDVIEFDSREFKVFNRKTISSSTAYMLVYVKRQLKQKLLNSEPIYPEWLEQRQIVKMEEKQNIKNRKNFYHNIQLLSWQSDILGSIGDYLGLIPRNNENLSGEMLQKISKTQRVQEWVKPYNQKNLGAYIYLTNFEKAEYETLINMQYRKSAFQQLIRDANTQISIIFFPLIASIQSILYVIKLASPHLSFGNQGQHEHQIKIKFQNILQANRNWRNSELLAKLKEIYDQVGYKVRYFYEQKKQLSEIANDNILIKGPPIQRNILSIIIVQKIQQGFSQKFNNATIGWYNDLKNYVQILVKSQDQKYVFQVQIDQNKSIESLREYIYDEKIKEQDDDCPTPQNIVLKGKPKKTAKNYLQITGASTIRDLIKNCDKQNIIYFTFSKLKADQRINHIQVKFSFRYSDFTFSDPFHIILDRKSENQSINIYQQIADHEQIKKFKQTQKKEGIRILLFSKDKKVINDMVSENGHVHGKGQIAHVLQKQKGAHLIVQSYDKEKIQQVSCPILLHHRSNNDEKIGTPRYMQFERSMKLTQIYQQLLQILKDESYEWEQKRVKLNPMKVSVYAFVKDYNKGVYLADQQTLRQFQIEQEERQAKEEQKLKSKIIKQKQKEKEIQRQKKQKQLLAIIQKDKQEQKLQQKQQVQRNNQVENGIQLQEDRIAIQRIVIESQESQKMKNGQVEKVNNSKEVKTMMPVQTYSQTRKNSRCQQKIQKIEKKPIKSWERTIQNTFPTARFIRIVVHHLYLNKAQSVMKINIE